MAWVKKGFAKALSTDTKTVSTAAFDTTGSDVFVAFVNVFASGPFQSQSPANMTDSAGNTWVYDSETGSLFGGTHCLCYHVFSPTTSATHTFSWQYGATPSVTFPSIEVIAFSGSTGATDGFSVTINSSGTSVTSAQAAATVGGTSGDIIIAGLGFDPSISSLSVDSGLTIEGTNAGSANAEGGSLAWLVTNSALNPTWSWTTAHQAEACVIALKGTAGASRGLFRVPPLTGVGVGGSFFTDPLQTRAVLIG